ncbi:12751_t:CDS:2 [Entrophospora sp. SA101]|nr:12751_t:CDS:2 [Entrophospora sp. SA101]
MASYLCSSRGGDLKRLEDSWTTLNNDNNKTDADSEFWLVHNTL